MKSGYTRDDADDILQDLMCAGNAALPRFNPEKAKRSTFLYHAIRDKAYDLARRAEREKRDYRREAYSLDDPWPGDESGATPWGDTLDADNTPLARRIDSTNLRIDLAEAIAQLPPELQHLCLLHMALRPDAARLEAGTAKSTHHRAVAKIRQFFERRGIGQLGG